ncbi:MAG: hypothetical protein KDD47_25325 [Acidobacteria bacterium]|nr:hypothetical protein [Acidobacteriota bacterium]
MIFRLVRPTSLAVIAVLGLAAFGTATLLSRPAEAANPGYTGPGDTDPDEPQVPEDPASIPELGAPCHPYEYQQEVWIHTCVQCLIRGGDSPVFGNEDWLLRCYLTSNGYFWQYAPGTHIACISRSC